MNQDDELYRLFLSGDNTGFEELVLRHKNHLIYYLRRLGLNFADAEDLAQDAFVTILLNKEQYKVGKGFKTYLYTIAHNKAVDFIRKNSRMVLVDEHVETEDDFLIEKHVLAEESKGILNKAIKELLPEEQELIYLVEFEELSYKDVAGVMKLSLAQVKVKLHRTRKKLEKILKREGFSI
ncbi:MAG: RNA polymerase sigma factor [Lachnospiraceae bacterium]|nr:RNA polymerase sigma factor [Lachnospiraceae bacterium]